MPQLVVLGTPRIAVGRTVGVLQDADLAEDAHVELEAEEGEKGEAKQGENYYVFEVLH